MSRILSFPGSPDAAGTDLDDLRAMLNEVLENIPYNSHVDELILFLFSLEEENLAKFIGIIYNDHYEGVITAFKTHILKQALSRAQLLTVVLFMCGKGIGAKKVVARMICMCPYVKLDTLLDLKALLLDYGYIEMGLSMEETNLVIDYLIQQIEQTIPHLVVRP